MAAVAWPLLCALSPGEEALGPGTRNHRLEEGLQLEGEARLAQAAATEGRSQHLQESDEKVET